MLTKAQDPADTLTARVERLVLEYALQPPTTRPLDARLALRDDLEIESLSLVSLALRLGDELGVDIVDLDLGELRTFGDLVRVAKKLSRSKANAGATL
jgi:acyl carrier protein